MGYYLRIIAQYAVTLLAALTINFFLPRLAPGDPLDAILPPDVIGSMSEAEINEVLADFGLDLPLWQQYWNYLTGVFAADFGTSTTLGMPVWDALIGRLPWTLLLMGCALLVSTLAGVALGMLAARKRGEFADVSIISTVLFVGSLPPFWLAMMLIILFSTTLGWLPSFGAYKLGVPEGSWAWYVAVIERLIMPVMALAVVQGASTLLIARSAMLMTLEQDYILFARARGTSERRVFFGHAFRNALLPLYTNVMLGLGGLIGGALVIETVFSYPGLGSLVVQGVTSRDYNLLQGIFVLATVSVLAANFLTDLFYPLIDPRTRQAR
ncbi:MAG: ABC transporter permease [Pseudomonadota bacterium]